MPKLQKIKCEICQLAEPKALHFHHIIEKTMVNTCNHPFNLAIICASCHNLVHQGEINIIGVYPSTGSQGRTLVYQKNGITNIPELNQPYFKPQPVKMKI